MSSSCSTLLTRAFTLHNSKPSRLSILRISSFTGEHQQERQLERTSQAHITASSHGLLSGTLLDGLQQEAAHMTYNSSRGLRLQCRIYIAIHVFHHSDAVPSGEVQNRTERFTRGLTSGSSVLPRVSSSTATTTPAEQPQGHDHLTPFTKVFMHRGCASSRAVGRIRGAAEAAGWRADWASWPW